MSVAVTLRVYYEDTDAGGVVYYANYLRFMERARTEWLRARGIEQAELARRFAILFAVCAADVQFKRPARLDDALSVTARVVQHGGASLTFEQQVLRSETVLCEGRVRVVCLDAGAFTPRPIPETLVAHLTD